MAAGTKVILIGCVGIAVLLGGCAVLFGIIASRETTKSPRTQAQSESAAPVSDPGASGAMPEPPPKWKTSSGASLMDDSPEEALHLESENEISGWLARQRPSLIVRCQEHKMEVYIVTGMPANPEVGLFNRYTVRVRLDDGPASTQRWTGSTDSKGLFAPNGQQLARQIARSKTLLFEFTPFGANRATATFDVHGLDKYLPKVEAACKR